MTGKAGITLIFVHLNDLPRCSDNRQLFLGYLWCKSNQIKTDLTFSPDFSSSQAMIAHLIGPICRVVWMLLIF